MTERFRPRLRPSARLRILGWMLGLTALAIGGSLLLSRSLLLDQLDAEVNGHLEQEVEEIRNLAGGRDPATGRPFGRDVRAIFDTFLLRNVPGDGEAYYTFVDGKFFHATPGPVDLGQAPRPGGVWAQLTQPDQGELDSDAGPVRWLALPLQDEEGTTLGVFVVANFLQEEREEITGVIVTSSAVAFATQQAFVDDAGHELRTPITIVRGHLELLGDDPDERKETVALVTDELDRMSRIVDDLLLLAKLAHPGLLRPETVPVEPFTTELFTKAKALGDRPWHLESTAAVTIVADPQRLTQAILNLARNAVEHAGPNATITLGSAAANGEVRFWVADTGAGIAADEQAAIFERFKRGGDRRRRSEGAGLGLAIVRAVADAHAGTVELASRPGDGSRFTLRIPTDPPGGAR